MSPMNKAAIWGRVSTEEQALENQIAQLTNLANQLNLEVVKIYRVEESAWRGAQQKYLTAVYEDAHKGDFQVLLVWALDRLSREGPMATLEIVHNLGRRKVQVISLQEPWTNVDGGLRDVLLALAGWIAEQESTRRSERTKAGMERVRASGKKLGRRSVLQDVNLELVGGLLQQGKSWRAIAKAHPHTVETPKGGFKRPGLATIRRAWFAYQNGGNGFPSNAEPE